MSNIQSIERQNLTVIKIGTGVLTRESDGQLDLESLLHLVDAVATLMKSGYPCVMVSSGAVGAGISGLDLDAYPLDIATRQACAAIGQSRLMHNYQSLFSNFGLDVAQLLLTSGDLEKSGRRDSVLSTLEVLLAHKSIIPIINENDCVSIKEISFGDNDMLSANVAGLLKAQRLILLTSVDGLHRPGTTEIIDEVTDISKVKDFARDDSGKFSIGGMGSKLSAVEFAISQGVETIIANGRSTINIAELIKGNGRGTRFKI